MRQKSSSNEKPEVLVIVTTTMINIIDPTTIKEKTDEEGNKYYEWEEDRYTGSEYVPMLFKENLQLKKQNNEDNETILDHEFRLMELEG